MSQEQAVMTFSFPTRIDFGAGARFSIGRILREHNIERPLIVTDEGVAPLPMLADIQEIIRDAGGAPRVFSAMSGNPIHAHVDASIRDYREHDADGIVAIGGGAPMDVSKALALMAYHPGDLFDYEDGKVGAPPVDGKIPFLMAVPTTAGTGSEVGRSAVISENETKVKRIIFSPRLLPERVLADPELTLGLPAHITAATGMDALSHLTEAYVAKGYHPMCDGIALEGIALVAKSLRACVAFASAQKETGTIDRSNEHLQARSDMLLAALMGAVAFQKGLGVTHSCAHALSTVCDLHHGLANGIMLPGAMAFNEASVPDRFDAMARTAGCSGTYVEWLALLRDDIGISSSLRTYGVGDKHLDALLEVAVADPCYQLNPREVQRSDFIDLFRGVLL